MHACMDVLVERICLAKSFVGGDVCVIFCVRRYLIRLGVVGMRGSMVIYTTTPMHDMGTPPPPLGMNFRVDFLQKKQGGGARHQLHEQ